IKHLKYIHKLLSITDKQLKEVKKISCFDVKLDINTVYYHFIKTDSHKKILNYNLRCNKHIYDIKVHKDNDNKEIIKFKVINAFNIYKCEYNASIQDYCYFCYNFCDNIDKEECEQQQQQQQQQLQQQQQQQQQPSSKSCPNRAPNENINIKYNQKKNTSINFNSERTLMNIKDTKNDDSSVSSVCLI
ncbi:hypothetical protein HEP_00533500, partial [Hepatocystis sp. ex Piliocolobus tephrosceles]